MFAYSSADFSDVRELPRPAAPPPPEKPQGLLRLLATLNRNPLEAWPRNHYENRIVVGRTPLGRFAIVNDPSAIRSVLVENPDRYEKDELQKLLLKPALGEGLLTSGGQEWRAQRRCFAPIFTHRKVLSFADAMTFESRALVERWQRFADGKTIDVAEEMARAMLDILARTLFSDGLGRDPGEFRKAATRYFETQGRIDPLDLLGAPSWLPRIGRILSRPALKFFPHVVEAILAERKLRNRDDPEFQADDFLQTLIGASDGETGEGLSDETIAANIITFIGAGFETPANALSWTLYLLSLDNAWRTAVEEEVDGLLKNTGWQSQIDQLVKTRALIEEAMRLYPPVAILSRKALFNHSLCGQQIAAGTTVIIAPWIVHRHQSLWDNPDHFDPLRFMHERRALIPRFAYIPFGAGPRVCIGAAFAMQQMTITLATIIRSFRLDLHPSHKVLPVHRVTLRPEGGMKMILKRRR